MPPHKVHLDMKISIANRTALFLSIFAIVTGFYIANNVFERLPHLEDEWAYIWQAQVAAKGEIAIESPPNARSVFIPFVVDYNGLRFGKYPPGWPMVLAAGILLGIKDLVNPLLGGLGVWLTYRLGRKIFNTRIGLIAAFLTVTSPFYLINSGSYLSHSWTYVLSTAFAIAWLDAFPLKISAEKTTSTEPGVPSWMPVLLAGLCLGAMVITRPFTAVGVAIPFFVHGLVLLVTGNKTTRLKVISIGALGVIIGLIVFLWQFAVTGDFLLNPYVLYWEYDKFGFGPGHGVVETGHTLKIGIDTAKTSLNSGWKDIFGWGKYSWILLPVGYIAILKNRAAWLTGSVYWSLVVLYIGYWVGAWVYGPRYYYEGLYSITLVSAAGISWLAGWHMPEEKVAGWHKYRSPVVLLLVGLLVGYNLFYYLPNRLDGMKGLYGVNRAMLEPFKAPETQKLAPALVLIHATQENGWRDYGVFATEFTDPWLTSPFIFAISRGPNSDAQIRAYYRDRTIIDYYMDGKINYTLPP